VQAGFGKMACPGGLDSPALDGIDFIVFATDNND